VAEKKTTRSSPVIGALARLLLPAIALLPLGLARAIGAVVGYLLAVLPTRARRNSEVNLTLCLPELEAAPRRRLVRRSLVETGRLALELGAVWTWAPGRLARLEAEVVGEELLTAALERGRGVVLLLPHVGNWEFFNHFLMRRTPFVALYRAPRIIELDALISRARERTGCAMAPATRAGVRQLLEALRGGGLLVMLPDQEPVVAGGEFAPFFGIPALTMTLLPRFISKTGATPLYGFARRTRSGRFAVHIIEAPAGLADPDPAVALRALNLGVERCVRTCPEQYHWMYKRFKTRPEGCATPYRKPERLRAEWDRLEPVMQERLRHLIE
jgi:KDO2-lipid IV(A) lauroyltransferase